jgi:hypothetical protein
LLEQVCDADRGGERGFVEEGDHVQGFVLDLLATQLQKFELGSYHAKHIADPRSHRLDVHCKGWRSTRELSRSEVILEPTSFLRTGLAPPWSSPCNLQISSICLLRRKLMVV